MTDKRDRSQLVETMLIDRDLWHRTKVERDELRAELERWKQAGEEWVERERVLTQERDVAVQYHRDASAANERLRAAAQQILDALDDGVPTQEEIEAFRTTLGRD